MHKAENTQQTSYFNGANRPVCASPRRLDEQVKRDSSELKIINMSSADDCCQKQDPGMISPLTKSMTSQWVK
jgi:hypothetical protein